MFTKLKDKLKGWFKSSKEKIEEEAEVVETEEAPAEKGRASEAAKQIREGGRDEDSEQADEMGGHEPQQPLEKEPTPEPQKPTEEKPSPATDTKKELSEKQKEKIAKKADKLIEKAKEQPSQPIPTKYHETEKQTKPDLEEVEKEAESIKKEIKKAEKKQKTKQEIGEIEKQIEQEKQELEEIEDEIKEKIEEIPQKVPETVKEAEEQSKKLRKVTEELEEAIEDKEELEEEIKEKIEEAPAEKGRASEAAKQIREGGRDEDSEQADELGGHVPDQPTQQPEQKKSFFSKLKSSLAYKITKEEFNNIFDDLEMLLLENNVALEAVEDIKSKLSEKLINKEIKKSELENEIKTELKNTLNELLIEPDDPLDAIKLKPEKPFVILFFGINGTGKTTSIAKFAHSLKKANISVVLAAGDTFRAASIEQISEHAEKLKVPLIKHDYNTDSAAVGFDAIKYAKNHKIDVVLIDTAGRMHTKTNLIEEMKKIERVTSPDLKIFVAESIAGNDATEQAKTFHKAIEIDGAILSKADIDEKGGTIISVSHATGKPIFYLGVGQRLDDLQLFNKQKFIESLGL